MILDYRLLTFGLLTVGIWFISKLKLLLQYRSYNLGNNFEIYVKDISINASYKNILVSFCIYTLYNVM